MSPARGGIDAYTIRGGAEAAVLSEALKWKTPACVSDDRFTAEPSDLLPGDEDLMAAICASCPIAIRLPCGEYGRRGKPTGGYWAGAWRAPAPKRTVRPLPALWACCEPQGRVHGRESGRSGRRSRPSPFHRAHRIGRDRQGDDRGVRGAAPRLCSRSPSRWHRLQRTAPRLPRRPPADHRPPGHQGERSTMTSSTNAHRSAYLAYREAQARAVNLPEDRTLSPAGRIAAQAAILRPARDALAAAVPSLTETETADPIAPVLASRRPTNADQVAVAAYHRDTVRTLVASGRNLARIIDSADEARLVGILSGIDTDPEVIGSSDPEAAAAEVQARIFDRLVAIGAEDAVAASVQLRESATAIAWGDTLGELSNRTGLSLATRTALRAVAPEDYDATVGADSKRPDEQNVTRLDAETARILHAADADAAEEG